jgi:hypothetical protein
MSSFINRAIKRFVQSLFPVAALRYRAYKMLIRNPNSYLHLSGWMQSLRAKRPIDNNGNLIPWMNFPVVSILEERLTQDLNLFEFGSGYSTLFYARKVRAVTSVEYDENWLHIIKSQIPENVKIIFKEKDVDGDYCRAIVEARDQYDVVIIDGRDRVNCIKQSIPLLSSKGVILLDDSQRERYQEGIDFAKRHGFKVLNLEGLKATGTEVDRTTIFYRFGNCFDI